MSTAKIYEGTLGLTLDIFISGVESFTGIQNAKLFVTPPDTKIEEEWPVTLEMESKVFRHVVLSKPLVRGTYKVQPYFELGDFKGRWGALSFSVSRIYT